MHPLITNLAKIAKYSERKALSGIFLQQECETYLKKYIC